MKTINVDGEYICSNSCDTDPSYSYNYYNDKYCIQNCEPGDYVIDGNEKICIKDCRIFNW